MTSTYYQLTDIVAGSFTFATDITQNQGVVDALLAAHPSSNLILNTPPVTPSAGDLYIIGPAPTGIWAGLADAIAIYTLNGYFYIPAAIGCRVNVNDGSTYIFGGGGWSLVSGGGGSSTIKFRSNYSSTTTDADPGSTNFRLDNATIGSATFINISDDAINSLNISSTVSNLKAGNQIYLENVNTQTEYLLATITSIVDNTTYYKINITIDDSSGPTWTDTETFEWVFMYPDTGSAGGSSIQFEFEYSNGVTATNPGSGLFKLNNTTIASATRLFINAETQVGANIASLLSLSTTSTRFYFENTSDPTQYLVLSVVSFVNNILWYDFEIAVEDSSGPTWTDTDIFGMTIVGSGAGQNITAFRLNYQDTITDTDPGSGNFQFDNLTIGSITFMNISDDALNSLDISSSVANLKVGNQFYMENIDLETEYLLATVTSVVDNTTYHKVNVTVDDSSGGTWSDDTTFELRFMYPDTTTGGTINVQDEGTPLTTAADTLNFVGAGVTASGAGTTKTITIPGGGGGSIQFVYTYRNNTTSADPGNGNFRLNNLTVASSTNLFLSEQSNSGADLSAILGSLETGDRLYFQNIGDSNERISVTISSITDNTTWFDIAYTVDDSSGPTWTNNADFGFILLFSANATANITTKFRSVYQDTTTDTDPGSTNFQTDNTTIGTSTFINISTNALNSLDISSILGKVSTGSQLYLENITSASEYILATIDSVVNNSTYYKINITVDDSSGPTWTDADTFEITFLGTVSIPDVASSIFFEDLANVSTAPSVQGEVAHYDVSTTAWVSRPVGYTTLDDSNLTANESVFINSPAVQLRNCTVASDLTYEQTLPSNIVIRKGRNTGSANISVRNHDATLLKTATPGDNWEIIFDGTDWQLIQ